MNGDGKPDLLTTNHDITPIYHWSESSVGVLLNTTALAARAVLPGASVSLTPNSVVASTSLTATGLPTEAHRLDALLYNALGQVVHHLVLPLTAGATQAVLPTATLPTGTYLLRLTALNAQGGTLGVLPTQRLAIE